MDNKLREAINKAILAHNLDCRQEAQDEKNAYIELIDTSMGDLIKEEFELTEILIEKMEKNKSYDKVDYKKKLYDALVESYNTDKDLFDSYGEVFSLKRTRDEKDKDQDPSAGSDRGTKRRKSSKDTESFRDSRSKDKNSSSTSKDASQYQHKSFDKSAHTEEPSHTVEDSGMQQDQEFVTGENDEQPSDIEVTKADWFKKPERPPTPDLDWSKKQQVDFRPPQTWIKCSKTTTERLGWHNPKNKPYSFDLRKPLPLIQDHQGRQIIPQDYFLNNDLEYLKGRELSRRYLTSVTKKKAATYDLKWTEDLVRNLWSPVQMYDYGHLEEIEVRRDDQNLYTFKEGDFKRLRLQDIEDMLLLLVQQKLTNLTINERYDLNVALRMYTRRIVIQKQVEDLQLGFKRKRLIRADELHKFIDGTLNDVRSALHDISARIRMEYLPMRKWSNLDKKRARVML
ncbi:hypothetical protein Tco_0162664 [Tanacetum coccineum]